MAERIADERLASWAAGQRLVEGELQPRKAVVVDAGVAENLGGDPMLRIETPLLRIEPEPGYV